MGACSSKGLVQSRILRKLYTAYAADGVGVDAAGLSRMCAEVNGTQMAPEVAEGFIAAHGSGAGLSFDDFVKLLFTSGAEQFHVEARSQLGTPEDLTQPMSHYFVNSSHNTYLIGAQFGGETSLEQFTTTVQQGCRCVELDCYDGDGDSGEHEPLVYHLNESIGGGALKVADIFAALQRALPQGHLPLMVNCENHMSPKTVERFVVLAKSVFGLSLFTFSEMKASCSNGALPSPERLRGRVLFRLKPKGNASLEKITALRIFKLKNISKGMPEPFESISVSAPKLHQLIKVTDTMLDASRRSNVSDDSASSDNDSDGGLDFEDVEGAYRYTKRYVARAYPKAMSIFSENFDPLRAWELGVELAALNWQTPGLAMDLNRAFFLRNGGCGFVLKPEWMLYGDHAPALEPEDKRSVSLTCIAAQPTAHGHEPGRFAEKLLDLYVRAAIHEPFRKVGKGTRVKTKHVQNDNRPIWDQELKLQCELAAMAFLRLELRDRDIASQDDLVATFAVWLPALGSGVRMIPMHDTAGTHVYTLLVLVAVDNQLAGSRKAVTPRDVKMSVK